MSLPNPPLNQPFLDREYVERTWADWFTRIVMGFAACDNRFTVVDATTTLTAGDSQIILADASGGAFTITLPAIADAAKYRYIIKKIDSSANAVTVDADGSETIDGALTAVITTQYEAPSFVPHGTEWSIV